jgi:Bacterial TSP3 repeat
MMMNKLSTALAIVLGALLLPAMAFAWCVGGAPPARDADGDGLNDIQEEFFGTSPTDADSDGDLIPDNLEDLDGDGLPNQDEPHIFSIELFQAPFGSPRFTLVIEGTQLFVPELGARTGTVRFPATGLQRRVTHAARNRRSRIHLRLSRANAQRLLGSALDSDIRLDSPLGSTNMLHAVPMPCATAEPHLMGAAIVELRTPREAEPLRYVVIGGCNLLELGTRPNVWTRVVVGSESFTIEAPYKATTTMLPTRILVPLHWRSVDDPVLPRPPDLVVGTVVRIENGSGESNAVTVEPVIAQLRIPDSHLDEDHDGDKLTSRRELELGTDPLVYDTDRDGLSDWREVRRGVTDPLDPDTNGDGRLDSGF